MSSGVTCEDCGLEYEWESHRHTTAECEARQACNESAELGERVEAIEANQRRIVEVLGLLAAGSLDNAEEAVRELAEAVGCGS